ncbi:hypothetical protein [Polaribacter porphyrae]|uniref:Peptidase M50 domain-containing protein n=1 Tax=Polaribacter porphyrae TaxID=1137780 RepID=A0A2S7WRA8_9FLAO|nr:hypothetical protein [Polaribacter porphyrae]PQJ80125.1 hypothetical protein BTO18_13485 [Polaribacter porphyrae]
MKIYKQKVAFIKYITILIIATFLTFFFHEMSHWIAYELLGYDASFTLNGAGVKDASKKLSKTEQIITSASGPIFTIIQAIVFYLILKKRNNILLYPFLFLPFVMRLGAAWANQFQPNDEGRISLNLNLNLYTISSIVVIFLFFLIFKISKYNKFSLFLNVITFVISCILMLGIAYFDAKYKLRFI